MTPPLSVGLSLSSWHDSILDPGRQRAMDGESKGSHHHHRNGFFFSSPSSDGVDWTTATGIMMSDGFFRDYDNGGDSASVKLSAVSSESAAGWSSPRLSSSGNYLEHAVSKFDTLAGVAIRYGVEVADIKRLNGLVTDIQMFAYKTLQIPRPGRRPPSACMSNGSNGLSGSGEHTPPRHTHDNLLDSFESPKLKSSHRKVSSTMSSLQGYYGLKSDNRTRSSGGCEMVILSKGGSHYLEDGSSGIPLSLQRKSRSVANGLFKENGESFDHTNEGFDPTNEGMDAESDRWSEKLIRRRQESETGFMFATPEFLLKENINSVAGGFSASAGKNLALRSKGSRASLLNDAETGPTSGNGVDTVVSESLAAVKKSSSASSLQDQESSSTSLLSTWNLKPDLQALSTAAIAHPIFDSLPKPGKKNKAALD